MHERENKYLSKQALEDMGFANLVKQADERVAAEAAGLDLRPLITKVPIPPSLPPFLSPFLSPCLKLPHLPLAHS
jgi:hypothetical protein